MTNLYNFYIPVCALFISVLCAYVFFSKKRAKNKETAIFGRLLIYNLIDCLLMIIILYLGGLKNDSLHSIIIF